MKKIFFSLLRAEIFNLQVDEEIKNLITPELLSELYKVSRRHDLAHLVGDALDKNGLLPEGTDVKKRFLQERNMAILRYEQMQYEYDRICEVLEQAKIQFLPLKGSVLRNYYPEPWMRTCCDIDILIKPEKLEIVKNVLMSKLGYKYLGKGPYDANMCAPSGVHVELRYNPSAVSDKSREVLSSIWDNVVDKNSYKLAMTNEMFYFYHLEHMAGHFVAGGCGVRFFLDVQVLNNTLEFNEDLKNQLLHDAKLDVFADKVEQTAECWFGNGEDSQLIQDFEEYVLSAGLYGRMKNRVAIKRIEKGKLRFLVSRIFLPYNKLKFKYPRLQKYPILFPYYQIKRWFNLFNKDCRKKSVSEFKEVTNGDIERQTRIAKLLKDLDL